MRLQTQVLVSLGLLWIAFLGIVYVGASDYLLSSLLRIEGGGTQEILINKYAFSQAIQHYLFVFIFVGIVVFVIAAFLLKGVFIKHENALQKMRLKMEEEVKMVDEMHRKVAQLEKRSEKADKVDGIFHDVCDHLNSLGTNVMVLKEQMEPLKNELVNKELESLENHFNEINRIIKGL